MTRSSDRARISFLVSIFLSVISAHGQNNLARGAAVEASGATWGGLVVASLTDGDPGTFVHPLASSGTLDYYFEIDLGRTYQFDRILLRNRADGCCPERLSNYRVELYGDAGGETGVLNWSATIRADGSNSGPAGVDTISAANSPAGNFSGRFIRVVNASNAPYNPQIAEIEVYGGLPPRIVSFTAQPDSIRSGESATLRWEILGAKGASLSPGAAGIDPAAGAITLQPGSTTTYTLTATNDAGITTASVKVGVDVVLLPPQISEFMADNQGYLKDEDGDSSDWIEIRNPNEFALDMEGFSLTDDPLRVQRWTFPALQISAGGYLVVFASGKDRKNASGELHADFRLENSGEYLALINPRQQAIQEFSKYPPLPKNCSYGLGSNQTLGFFRAATPGTANGTAFAGIVSDTKFSHDRGFYETNFAITISSATPGAVIRYTLNRSDVTATSGQIYSSPIPITGTTVLRAAAFKDDWAATDVDTHTYIFPSNVIASAVMRTNITRNPAYADRIKNGLLDVPSISLVTPRTINGSAEAKTSFEWLPFGTQNGTQTDCGVRNFGGAFTTFAKKSFRLYFRGEYGATRLRYPVFDSSWPGADSWPPATEFDQLELRNGSHDMVERGFYMSNVFTDDTLLEMGQLNPHGRFVHLYLNGTYWGLYHLRERWGASMHQSYLGGSRTNYESINGNWNVGGWAEPGTAYDGDGSAWARIKELRSNYSMVRSLLDVPQYIDYMLVWLFGGSEDEYRCVGPNEPGSGFKFYLNDADGWFCGSWYCAAGNRTSRGAPGRSGGDGPGSIFSMLFKEAHPDYRVLLADRIYKALGNEGALTPSQNAARLRARTSEIERAFIAEAARWNYLSPAEWSNRRNQVLSNWFPSRTTQVLSDFRGTGFYPSLDAPVFAQTGGSIPAGTEISFIPPNRGTIYFTVDGSDPRLPGGAVSPRSTSYSSGRSGETVLPAGSVWRWFTDGVGLGSSEITLGHAGWSAENWKHPQYDDSSWRSGPAQLGYGEGDEATVIPYGADSNRKWTTAYFRRGFNLQSAQEIVNAQLRLKRDDGVIVYINGREAVRSAMAAGTVTGSTFAQGISDDGQDFNAFSLPVSFLVPGFNIIAVELHQTSLTTSDASFDLEIEITRNGSETSTNLLPRINESTVVKARAKDGSTWSALAEAFFQVGPGEIEPGELALTELNYDPSGKGCQFIELSNRSSRALNLRGVSFVEGVDFVFPRGRDHFLAPGQKIVLVRDLFRFQQVFGNELPVAGIYSGKLSRAGENIRFAQGTNILGSVSYGTRSPWPLVSSNFSLVLSHPQLGQNNPAAWRSSAHLNGTPGETDSSLFSGRPDEDQDGDGFPALLEYALGTDDLDPASGPDDLAAAVDQGRLTLTFPRALSADDVLLQCEVSDDLATWSPAQRISAGGVTNGIAHETWGIETVGIRARFLRLRLYR